MPLPTWAVGQVLSASDVNSYFVPLTAIKGSDTGRTNNSVLADPDLVLAASANSQYDVRVVLRYKGGSNTNSDAQFQINVPASSSGFYMIQRINISGLAVGFTDSAFGSPVNAGTNGTGNTMQAIISASVSTSASSGNITLLWGQNTTNGTATTLMQGSFMVAQRIG